VSSKRERENRRVPLDARTRARCLAELPSVIAYRETRLLHGHRTWGIEAVAYGAITMLGLLWGDWSPVLVLLHLMLSQWIALLAEVLVLRRLAQRGITRLVSAGHVDQFVTMVVAALGPGTSGKPPEAPPMVPERYLLDSQVPSDSTDKSSPADLAVTAIFLGALASAFMVGSLVFAERSLRDELLSQPLALLLLGAMSVVQLVTSFRSKLAPPWPGASWNVEFTPLLRVFGMMMLGMMSVGLLQAREETSTGILAIYGCIAAWGVVTLATLGLLRAHTQRMKTFLEQQTAVDRLPG
jgi:hypothetical protein